MKKVYLVGFFTIVNNYRKIHGMYKHNIKISQYNLVEKSMIRFKLRKLLCYE
jgi:hypothetical protein